MVRDSLKLGPLEMEVIGLLEGQRPSSVQDIQKRLESQDRELAYTTVMTILSRLFRKGLLKREKSGRHYCYSLAVQGEKARAGVLSTVYQSLFKSNRLRPIVNLIDESEDLSAEELQQLKHLLEDKLRKLDEQK